MRHFSTPIARQFIAANSNYFISSAAGVSQAPLTMACWFTSTNVTTTQILMSLSTAGATARFQLTAAGATAGDPIQASTVDAGGSTASAATTTGYVADRWHHATAIFASSSSRTAYLDAGGNATNTTLNTGGLPDRFLVSGRINAGSAGAFHDGLIVWPAFWNVALDLKDILALAAGAYPLTVRRDALVAFWDWTGAAGMEFGWQGRYPLTNTNGTRVSTAPTFLKVPYAPRRRRKLATGNRRRRIIMGASA